MSGPRFKGRELVFIGLPTAMIVAGAAFLSRQQAVREQNRSGSYRTEITRVEILPVSPFEAWQGFDTKIVVYADEFGQLKAPDGLQLSPEGKLEQKVALFGRVNGQPKSISVTSQDYANGFEPEHPGVLRALMLPNSEVLKNTLTFLASTSGFDADSPIQLRGEIWSEKGAQSHGPVPPLSPQWTSENRGAYWWNRVKSQTATLSQLLEWKTIPDVNRTPPPVDRVEAELLSPVYAHTGL